MSRFFGYKLNSAIVEIVRLILNTKFVQIYKKARLYDLISRNTIMKFIFESLKLFSINCQII